MLTVLKAAMPKGRDEMKAQDVRVDKNEEVGGLGLAPLRPLPTQMRIDGHWDQNGAERDRIGDRRAEDDGSGPATVWLLDVSLRVNTYYLWQMKETKLSFTTFKDTLHVASKGDAEKNDHIHSRGASW